MLGRRTYQNNFSSNSVVTVVVEKTTEVGLSPVLVRSLEVAKNTLTHVEMQEGLTEKDGIALIVFGDNRVIMSVVKGKLKIIDSVSTGSDTLGNLIVSGNWAQLTTGDNPLEFRVTFVPC